jgi:hypothetical protein
MIKPISPQEVSETHDKNLPEFVIEAFNNLILANFIEGECLIHQNRAISEIMDVAEKKYDKEVTRKQIFDNRWLDIESAFRKNGWKVEYDKPGFNETYEAYWTFKSD